MALVVAWLTEVVQLALLALLAPFLVDVMSMAAAVLSGARMSVPGERWRQIATGWRGPCEPQGAGPAWAACALSGGALAITPLISVDMAGASLADPLAIGLLLLGARAVCWQRAFGAGCVWRRDREAQRQVAIQWRMCGWIVPVLGLVSALMAIGLPGAAGLAGLARDLHVQAAPALVGALVFAALALGVLLGPQFLDAASFEVLLPEAEGRLRAMFRYSQDLASCGWLLLIGDLMLPGLPDGATLSIPGMLMAWVAAPVRLVLVAGVLGVGMVFLRGDVRRPAVALAGAAIILVLSGRFAS
ncbi:hypothetical protein [Brytella acorum]|uniref:Uncharacterized protein n=1 Tax=Brytella acorum TaxID=2959299 RepID=A0AA35XWY6_9PROT|nr:hypothetical protein [Brytella acorum]MDF3623508.1 hypothetical protein [Brytella acorum]CAI9121359.1 hypothetical protein LMG32879_002206 [Brytella acorum]